MIIIHALRIATAWNTRGLTRSFLLLLHHAYSCIRSHEHDHENILTNGS